MITSLYAGLLGVIYLGLTFFTIKGRLLHASGLYGVSPIKKSRPIGMMLTIGVILAASIASIVAYFLGVN
ncbi:MAG: hypothetical protein CMH31_05010 [Micavibrio sp.]|nr:hypothetical protein [Micavibrio sp.]|tara:strand:+ start:1483 stop:1692 length:210 start_codon:yes stop_codon:yes gene_type:complete